MERTPRRWTRRRIAHAPAVSATTLWLRGIRFSGFSFIMLAILVLAVVVLAPNVRIFAEQRQQIATLETDVAAREHALQNVTAERERWNDRNFITAQARDRLYFVMPGEVSYLVINDADDPAAGTEPAPVTADLQETRVDWVGTLFASVMTAGLAPDAAGEASAPAPDPAAGEPPVSDPDGESSP